MFKLIIIFFFIVSCNLKNKAVDKEMDYKYCFVKDDICLKYYFINNEHIFFCISSKKYGLLNYTGVANLILIEDNNGNLVLPEGTNRIDYNNVNDLIGIKCDSTFQFRGIDLNKNNLELVFAPENNNGKRLDFILKYKKYELYKTLIKVEQLNKISPNWRKHK
jgi:hypothetical protein